MFTKERADGTYIRNINFFTQITPYVKPVRTDSVIVFEQEYDVTKTAEFIQEKNIPFTHVFLYAALRTITTMPKINRFVSGLRYYQRNNITFTFNENDSDTTMSFSPLLTLEKFCKKIQDRASSEKTMNPKTEKTLSIIKKMPRFIIKFLINVIKFLNYHNALPASFTNSLPYFCSLILIDTASIDIDAVYYPNFDIGTCGIFCTIGKINTIDSRKKMRITVTYDGRITDPTCFVQALNLLRDLTENPEKLETPPEWTTEQFVRLGLTEKELNDV